MTCTIVTIHGIHNSPKHNNWQNELSDILELSGLDGIRHLAFKAPFMAVPLTHNLTKIEQMASKISEKLINLFEIPEILDRYLDLSSRLRLLTDALNTNTVVEDSINRFREFLVDIINSKPEPKIHVIAHSLGCYIACEAIKSLPAGKSVASLRLMAPPMSPSYPLAQVKQKVSQKIFVEYSSNDDFLRLLKATFSKKGLKTASKAVLPNWVCPNLTFAGMKGFSNECSGLSQVPLPKYRHNDFVSPLRALEAWLPALGLIEPLDFNYRKLWFDFKLRDYTFKKLYHAFGFREPDREFYESAYPAVRALCIGEKIKPTIPTPRATKAGVDEAIGILVENSLAR